MLSSVRLVRGTRGVERMTSMGIKKWERYSLKKKVGEIFLREMEEPQRRGVVGP
jgi:hypothetical protein